MNEHVESGSVQKVAAYVGIDWADEKHDVVLRAAAEPAKAHHQVIKNKPEALLDWVGEIQQRYRETFKTSGAKDDKPDAGICSVNW